LSSISHETSEINLSQTAWLSISAESLLPFKDLLKNFFTFYKFISFAFYDAPPIISVNMTSPELIDAADQNQSPIEICYSDNFYNNRYKEKTPYSFLFSYTDAKGNFSTMIEKWFALFDKLSPSVNMLNQFLLKRGFPLEIKFLLAIQAVETFHRNLFGGTDLPEEEHEKRSHQIYDSVPSEHLQWVKEQLQFSNELRLRKRLNKIYDSIPQEITKQLIKDRKSFINLVVNGRNYYTHYSEHLKETVMDIKKIAAASEKMYALLTCSILSALGLQEDEIIKIAQPFKLYPYVD